MLRPVSALAHFLYISRATVPFDDEALDGLLQSARRFNEAHDVTGLLLYDVVPDLQIAQFCQYVEGPPPAIAEVRRRIESDSRHTALAYLHEGVSGERLFPTWSMGYEHVPSLRDTSRVHEHLGIGRPARPGETRNRSAALLRTFIGMSPGGGRRTDAPSARRDAPA